MQQVYLNLSRSVKKCELPGTKCVCFSVSSCLLLSFYLHVLKFDLYVIRFFVYMIFSFYEKNVIKGLVCYLGSCMFLRYFVYDDQFLPFPN